MRNATAAQLRKSNVAVIDVFLNFGMRRRNLPRDKEQEFMERSILIMMDGMTEAQLEDADTKLGELFGSIREASKSDRPASTPAETLDPRDREGNRNRLGWKED